MKRNSVELQVFVRGKPVTEYRNQGKVFVEGREGSEFELRVKNNLGHRVLIVPSVDGLSVMDGQEASSQSQGYVLNAYQEMPIPGWRLDNDGVAKFIFEDMKASYAEQVGKGANRGVIGLKVFAEKKPKWVPPVYNTPVVIHHWPQPHPQPIIWTTDHTTITYGGHVVGSSTGDTSRMRTKSRTAVENPNLSLYSGEVKCAVTPTSAESEPTMGQSEEISVNCNFVQEANEALEGVDRIHGDAENIGVGFGEAAEHKVQEVTFNKGHSLATFAIYYDSRKGLEKRGITVVSNQKPLPEPFPASACTPPPGWAETHSR